MAWWLIVESPGSAEPVSSLELESTTGSRPAHHMDSGSASSSARTPLPIGAMPMAEEEELSALQRTKEVPAVGRWRL